MDRHEAIETSPLLKKHSTGSLDDGRSHNSVVVDNVSVNGHQNGDPKPAEDEESQANGEERAPQYEGIPEVKAKLAYILPALSIGVSLFFNVIIHLVLTYCRSSSRPQIRPLSCLAMGRLEVTWIH